MNLEKHLGAQKKRKREGREEEWRWGGGNPHPQGYGSVTGSILPMLAVWTKRSDNTYLLSPLFPPHCLVLLEIQIITEKPQEVFSNPFLKPSLIELGMVVQARKPSEDS